MSLKSRLEENISDTERENKRQENEHEAKKKQFESRVDQVLQKTEYYFTEFVLPVLIELNETMGGTGPCPDGSLPWRGGRSWTNDPRWWSKPNFEDYRPDDSITAWISGQVVWDVYGEGSGRSYHSVISGAITIEVNHRGMAWCKGPESNKLQIDLTQKNAKKRVEDAVLATIKQMRDRYDSPYKPGVRAVKVPLDVQQARDDIKSSESKRTLDQFATPLLREVARRKNVNMSQDPYIVTGFFGGEVSKAEVPVRSGLIEKHEGTAYTSTLICRVISKKEADPAIAVAVELTAESKFVMVRTGRYESQKFDITNSTEVDNLKKLVDDIVRREATIEFAKPYIDHPSP